MRRYTRSSARRKKYIFIDRDGVINKDPGGWTPHSYVTDPKDFIFLPGALDALTLFNKEGYGVVIISNQAGVGKGYFTDSDLERVTSTMREGVGKRGGKIDATYYCVHRKEDNCPCRKPRAGLLFKAAKDLSIDLSDTYFIGDNETDIIAGQDAGVSTVLVLCGKTSREDMRGWTVRPDYIFKNLIEAAVWLVAKERRRAERAFRREKQEEKKDE